MKLVRLLPALLLSGIVSGASAQSFSIGPKVGANFSTFTVTRYNVATPIGEVAVDEMEKDTDQLVGAHAGVMFNIGFDDNISIQPELLYSAKGYKQGGKYNNDFLKLGPEYIGTERDYTVNLNYIELPVLFKVSFGSPTIKGSLMLGPYFSYLLGGKNDLKLGGEEIYSGDLNYEFTEKNPEYYFQRWDYGGTFGAGVSFRTSAGSFLLDARYNVGIPETMSYNPSLGDVAVRNQNQTVGISLGWLYHFPYAAKPVNDYGGVFDDDFIF